MSAGEAGEAIDFRLRPAGIVRGVVVDNLGIPRSGALISVAYRSDLPMRAMLASAIGGKKSTSEDGTFQLSEIITGVPVRVYAVSQGQRAEAEITLQGGGEVTALQLLLR